MSHKMEVGKRRSLACHYTLTTACNDILSQCHMDGDATYRLNSSHGALSSQYVYRAYHSTETTFIGCPAVHDEAVRPIDDSDFCDVIWWHMSPPPPRNKSLCFFIHRSHTHTHTHTPLSNRNPGINSREMIDKKFNPMLPA